jgi:hypothetical protein
MDTATHVSVSRLVESAPVLHKSGYDQECTRVHSFTINCQVQGGTEPAMMSRCTAAKARPQFIDGFDSLSRGLHAENMRSNTLVRSVFGS